MDGKLTRVVNPEALQNRTRRSAMLTAQHK